METALITPYTHSSLRAIKIAALYFDEINLQQRTLLKVETLSLITLKDAMSKGVVRDIINFIDDKFVEEIQPLVTEGIISICQEPEISAENRLLEERLRDFFYINDSLLIQKSASFNNHDYKINFADNFADEVHEKLVGPLDLGSWFHPDAIYSYYVGQFSDAVRHSLNGTPILSSSKALFSLLQTAASKEIFNSTKNIDLIKNQTHYKFAFDVLEALVLDVGDLRVDEILEARLKLKDELDAFRSELQTLQFEYENEFGLEKIINEGRQIAKARLLPKIKDLEQKIIHDKHTVMKSIFTILRKPDAYIPMLGTTFAGIPLELSFLISLGIVSTEFVVDLLSQKKDIKRDGLFYLIKMRSESKKSRKKPKSKKLETEIYKEDLSKKPLRFFYSWQVSKVQ